MLKRGEAVFANIARTPPQHFRATIFKILFSIYQINFNHILQDCHTATLKCREHVLAKLADTHSQHFSVTVCDSGDTHLFIDF